MSLFREALEYVRETVTVTRWAYAVGVVVSGGVGHCVAIGSVIPRVEAVEVDLGSLRAHVALDRRVLDRLVGMTESIADRLAVDIPPPIPLPTPPWLTWPPLPENPHD